MILEKILLESANPYARKIEFVDDDGHVLGYLDYSFIYDRIEIDYFFVEEAYRNKGIGKKILSYLIAIAINLHVINITLEVRKKNEIARNLYQKFGFREVALRKFYYGDDDGILMEKQVM